MLFAIFRNKQLHGVLAVIAAAVIASDLGGAREWLFAIPVRATRFAEQRIPQLVQSLFDGLG